MSPADDHQPLARQPHAGEVEGRLEGRDVAGVERGHEGVEHALRGADGFGVEVVFGHE
jgi:hypothetical protein